MPEDEAEESHEERPAPSSSNKTRSSLFSFLSELPLLILTAIVVAWVIKSFVAQPFYIPSGSMEPTLMPGDRVLVSKLSYRLGEPRAKDVVVFIAPQRESAGLETDFIKRIVATPGMTVEVDNGTLLVDSQPQKEPYVRRDIPTSNFGPQKVPSSTVFVMGDNRANSKDSRFFGPIAQKDLIGKAVFVYWPPERMGRLK